MRILYHHRIKSRDGQFIHIRSMIDAFKGTGQQVEEIGLTAGENFSLGEESRFWKGFVHRMPSALVELLNYVYSLPAAIWLRFKIMRCRADFIYERYALGNFAGLLAARLSRIPILLEVNSPLAQEARVTGDLRFKYLARISERLLFKSVDRILVVSNVLKEICLEQGIPPEKVTVIPNGIDPGPYENRERKAFRERYGLNGSVVVGFVGFFRNWHRLDRVLNLLAGELSDLNLKLMLVGDGPARPELEKIALDLNLKDRVIWTGILEHDEVPDALAAMDIALQSEVTEYSSPLKLFEYMAAARPIVAPRRSNMLEILEDNENGLLFDPEDSAQMADALRRLVLDEDLRRRLGEAARLRLIEGGFTWEANARRILQLFEKDMACIGGLPALRV